MRGPRWAPHITVVLVVYLASRTLAYLTQEKPHTAIEVVEESGCKDTEFRLTCRGLNSLIAIRDAVFVPDNTSNLAENDNSSCVPGPVALALNGSSLTMSEDELALLMGTNISLPHAAPHIPPDYNLRPALNRRCSGVNHCSFILRDDHAPARDWGRGTVSIRYACMPENRVSKFCGERVNVSQGGEGFLMTPGYPKYYVGEKECIWEVKGGPGQAIGLEVLDLALRGVGPLETSCTDVLEVWAGGSSEEGAEPQLLLSVCGERANLPVVRSTSGPLRIVARTASKTLFPNRGVLLRYTALSCPAIPPAPKDGYLVHSNNSDVLYMCCVGMAFPDSGSRKRQIHCTADFSWDFDVPDCVNATLLPHRKPDVDTRNLHRAIMVPESDYILDLVVPSVVIAALLIGNAFIIAIIFHLKKRHLSRKEQGDPEELGEILPREEANGACV